MARKNNSRNLRSSEWSNPMFCQYVTNKINVRSWTNRLQILNNTSSFQNKFFILNKKNKKKSTKVLKQARSIVMTSAQNSTVIPLQSKAVTLPRQFKLKKLMRKRKKKNKKVAWKKRYINRINKRNYLHVNFINKTNIHSIIEN